MKIHLEFEPHEQQEVIDYLQAQDEAVILHDFRGSIRGILKHSDDEELIKHAEWAQEELTKLED
jgi:hypothetical protein